MSKRIVLSLMAAVMLFANCPSITLAACQHTPVTVREVIYNTTIVSYHSHTDSATGAVYPCTLISEDGARYQQCTKCGLQTEYPFSGRLRHVGGHI